MNKDPFIILIGGASGTGKSTLSKNLSERLNIIHRVGTGFVREILRSQINMQDNPYMFGFTFEPCGFKDPVEKFVKQSSYMKDAISACIDRAYDEGTSLIIEGAHIIPGLIQDKRISLTVLLYNPYLDLHFKMINGPTHFKRVISDDNFAISRKIQDWLLGKAEKYNVPVLESSNGAKVLDEAVKLCPGY